jgi:succinate dehydrogenase / fumarate reductase cytochrome b subunit
VAVYVVAMLAVALHVSHGFWSLFQTLGANHPKYMPAVMAGSVVFALVVAAGFGFIPIYLAMS